MGAPVPDAIIRASVAYIHDGWTVPAVADLMGIRPATLRRRIRARGIDIPDGRRSASGGANRREWTTEQTQQAIRAYQEGRSIGHVAVALGTGARQARELLVTAGVQLRPDAATASRLRRESTP